MISINGITVGIIVALIGLYGILTKSNIIKMVMCLYIMNSGVILSFISLGYVFGGEAAIFENGIKPMVDPLPQAVMLTTLVIGLGITALALALSIKIFENYRTLSTKKQMEREK